MFDGRGRRMVLLQSGARQVVAVFSGNVCNFGFLWYWCNTVNAHCVPIAYGQSEREKREWDLRRKTQQKEPGRGPSSGPFSEQIFAFVGRKDLALWGARPHDVALRD